MSMFKVLHSGKLTLTTGSVEPAIDGDYGTSSLMKTHMTSLRIYESSTSHAVTYHPLQAKQHCYR